MNREAVANLQGAMFRVRDVQRFNVVSCKPL